MIAYRNRLNECQIRDSQILFSWRHRESADHSFDVWIGDRRTITVEIWPDVKLLCQVVHTRQITFNCQFRQQIVEVLCNVPEEKDSQFQSLFKWTHNPWVSYFLSALFTA